MAAQSRPMSRAYSATTVPEFIKLAKASNPPLTYGEDKGTPW
jgi:hypothetical protein